MTALIAGQSMMTSNVGRHDLLKIPLFLRPGVQCFAKLRFAAKALLILLVSVLPLLILVMAMLQQQSIESRRARMDATRQHVEIAHGILVWAYSLEKEGLFDRVMAQALARRAISALRYEEQEYFWINDMQPRVVVHPINPALEGKDVRDVRDPNGLAVFQAFVDQVRKEGKGFVMYQWPRPGGGEPVDKISYVMGFEPWGWVVGSGIYVDDLRAADRRRWLWAGLVTVIVVLMVGYLFLSFYWVIQRGLQESRRLTRTIAKGDLTWPVRIHGNDELADLMRDLEVMQSNLRKMVRKIRGAVNEMMRSSAEVASVAQNISEQTERSAANLEETSASMSQIVTSVESGSDLLVEVARTAQESAKSASAGGAVMEEVERTMDHIQQSSQRIGEIIGTIDAIAFQTNILALNAAVEAARAGEHGRGFAVVAAEVRSLAQRSAAAAREIKALVGSSIEQVGAGAQIVTRAGRAMREIVTSSERVERLLEQVARGVQEQNAGIVQIGQAIQELDRVTQQNAAVVGQASRAATTVRNQAEALVQEINCFVLSEVEGS